MRRHEIHLTQSLRRSQYVLNVRADVLGAVNHTDARAQLDGAVITIDAAVDLQGTCLREWRGEVKRRKGLEKILTGKFMTPLSKFSRAELVGTPEFAALTPSATQLRTERLVASAHSMASAAAKWADRITAAQFPADFLQQLRAAANAVQASINAAQEAKVKLTGATKTIATAIKQGRSAVAKLDSAVSHMIVGNEPLKREWRTAKRVTRTNGPLDITVPAAPAAIPAPGAKATLATMEVEHEDVA